ncbi:NAD-dependent epimerase/dehydratase family protein [Labrys monachus]|uniref:Nucleoside-diphosphate-sugar epimerase n=1 Tax=Labrys monachus TaxID=217067 RepID=A0ABU0F7U9_9HYPH|nr:NAD(P)-dependent oxidoreductase [Labrys monachus]MDQ0390650.1 nucleoside-diphosphate-sugar epimerase [Labrys monachus]
MGYRIFLAGAAGAVGRRLIPLLLGAGHSVAGTTRSAARAGELKALGVEPVMVDVFDARALSAAVAAAGPEIVIHQLTDLPPGVDPARMAEAITGNARIRDEGTRNLVAAAMAAGARRLVAQSIAWAYADGPEPHREEDALDIGAEGARAISVGGVIALERHVLKSPLGGVVLRYGRLYGPGTGVDAPPASMPLHVDAAAHAALLAIEGPSGIFNIAEPGARLATDKARILLGWHADFRLPLGGVRETAP